MQTKHDFNDLDNKRVARHTHTRQGQERRRIKKRGCTFTARNNLFWTARAFENQQVKVNTFVRVCSDEPYKILAPSYDEKRAFASRRPFRVSIRNSLFEPANTRRRTFRAPITRHESKTSCLQTAGSPAGKG